MLLSHEYLVTIIYAIAFAVEYKPRHVISHALKKPILKHKVLIIYLYAIVTE
jgi:hypothetical protein